MTRKKNLALYIDGENISAKKGQAIKKLVDKRGVIDYGKVYGLQKDNHTKAWTDFTKNVDNMKDIRLYGKPQKNKVDDKIKKDIITDIKAKSNIDIVVLASSDHGYAEVIKQLRDAGKHVIVIGEEKTPACLRKAPNKFVVI